MNLSSHVSAQAFFFSKKIRAVVRSLLIRIICAVVHWSQNTKNRLAFGRKTSFFFGRTGLTGHVNGQLCRPCDGDPDLFDPGTPVVPLQDQACAPLPLCVRVCDACRQMLSRCWTTSRAREPESSRATSHFHAHVCLSTCRSQREHTHTSRCFWMICELPSGA